MVKVLTEREKEIIEKKINGVSLTQNESNILSRYIRPKLREIQKIDAEAILKKIDYSQKAAPIEKKLKKLILNRVPKVDSITLCGSAVQNNYKEYNDLDVIIATKNKLEKKSKIELIRDIEKAGKDCSLNLDIQIYSKDSIIKEYPRNPSLIYQLKDSKVIYGKLKIAKKISLTNLDLRMKLDWSEADTDSYPSEIYSALRNAVLVSLLLQKKVNNYTLRRILENALGDKLVYRLKNNSASPTEKKFALQYLYLITQSLEEELKSAKWEKIEIENP